MIARVSMAAVLLWPFVQSAQQPPTLSRVLARYKIVSNQGLPQNLLNSAIYGYALDTDQRATVLAFFDATGELHAASLDRPSGRWQHALIRVGDAVGAGNSITRLKRTARYIYLNSHINPSASRLIILSPDLKLRRALYGWEIAMLRGESVVYHHSQIHFAPTHSLEISVFNPATLKEKQIYPPKLPQPVRRDFIARVAQEYRRRGEEWFKQHNHHMNPELFDSRLAGEVTVEPSSKSIRFVVEFGDPENARDPLSFTEKVLVTCGPVEQLERIECREEKAR